MKNELMVFNNDEFEVEAKEVNGNLEFKIDGIAKSLGFIRLKSDKEYIMWDRVNKYLTEIGFPHMCGKDDFIPEQYVYLLCMKASNDLAVTFQKWLAFDVLPSIRKHGAYISENADEEYVNNELRFSKKRTIKSFANANVSEVKKLYSDFRTYVDKEFKYKTDERVARYKSVEKGLEILHNQLAAEGIENIGDCYNLIKLKKQVIIDRTTLEKRISGGNKTAQTKKIKQLEEQLDNSIIYPQDWEFVILDVHGMSNNYLFEGNGQYRRKTITYKKWIDHFPYDQVPDIDYWEDVDFTKPIEVFINYVMKKSMDGMPSDHHNCDKATIDMIFNRIYEVDDSIVERVHSQKVGECRAYNDGKISFFIRNLE